MNAIQNTRTFFYEYFLAKESISCHFLYKRGGYQGSTAFRFANQTCPLLVSDKRKVLVFEDEKIEFLFDYFFFEVQHCLQLLFGFKMAKSESFRRQFDDCVGLQIRDIVIPLGFAQFCIEHQEVREVVVLHLLVLSITSDTIIPPLSPQTISKQINILTKQIYKHHKDHWLRKQGLLWAYIAILNNSNASARLL